MTVVPLRKVEPIGGSEAAAAAGIDPHCSRLQLWLYKTGRAERPETEAMRWGTAIEPLIFEALRERGIAYARRDDLVRLHIDQGDPFEKTDDARPWMIGHPDGLVIGGDGATEGLLEVKTAGHWSGREWRDGVPFAYQAQVQHYLHLTGLERALLACLVAGQKLELVWLRRDQRAIDLLLSLEEDFYGYLVRDEPPLAKEDDREALAAMFPEATAGRKVRLVGDDWALYRELRARREQREAVDRQVEVLTNMLKQVMGEAELAIGPHDEDVISWRNVESQRVDVTALREKWPGVAAEFVKTTTTRRFALL
jgi:putative phage-type endonuclease